MMTHRFLLALFCVVLIASGTKSVRAEVDFEKQIRPIFLQDCASCHGEKKGLGKLRLHTAKAIQEKAAADDHLIVAGKPEASELFERLVLPVDHKKRMPKKADPLAKEKVELIRQWIAEGASYASADADEPAETNHSRKVASGSGTVPLPEVEPANPAAIARLSEIGAQVVPLFSNSSLLDISFAFGGSPASDADVAALEKIAPQVYSLNLAGSQLSPTGFATLAKLENLSRLHLENSSMNDAALASIAGLRNLQYLNLYGTSITNDGIAQLRGLQHLRSLYLWKTKVSYDAAMELEKAIPGLQVDLGFDHPVVARKRLTKKLAAAEAHAKAARADEAELKHRLDAATKSKASAEQHLEEVKKKLAALGEEAVDVKNPK